MTKKYLRGRHSASDQQWRVGHGQPERWSGSLGQDKVHQTDYDEQLGELSWVAVGRSGGTTALGDDSSQERGHTRCYRFYHEPDRPVPQMISDKKYGRA
jgi:hypothetical protein